MENLNQQSLFGEPITFGRSVDHAAIRQAAMKRAQRNQSDAFNIEFRNFFLKYADAHAEFSAEDVRDAYCKTNLPKPISLKTGKLVWQASGPIVQGLLRSKKIVFLYTITSPTRGADIKVFRKA